MNQEDRELLLKDLSSRLPYGVKVNNEIQGDFNVYGICENFIFGRSEIGHVDFDIEKIKPYLFPLESMTEEQKQEYTYIVNYISPDDTDSWKEGEFIYIEQFNQLKHFYHINHLDYNGLIPKGLAIDASNLNIY